MIRNSGWPRRWLYLMQLRYTNTHKANAANDDTNHSTALQKLAKVLSPPEKGGLIKAERVGVLVPSSNKKEKK